MALDRILFTEDLLFELTGDSYGGNMQVDASADLVVADVMAVLEKHGIVDAKFKAGSKVKHNFSANEGRVLTVKVNPNGYNYFVRWTTGIQDWYRADVLVAV